MLRRFFGERRQTQSGSEGRDTAPSNVVRVTHPRLASRLPPLAWITRKNNARSACSCYLSWPEFYSPANRWVRGRWLKSHCLPVGWLDILNNKTQHSLNNQNPIPQWHTDPTLRLFCISQVFYHFSISGSFQRKISGSKRRSEKVVLFPGWNTRYFKRKFLFHFFKPIFHTSFRCLRPFFDKWHCLVQMVSSEFYFTFIQTVNRLVYLLKW